MKSLTLTFCFCALVYNTKSEEGVSSRVVQYRNCKSAFEIKKVEVSPCDMNPRPGRRAVQFCPVVHNTTASITVTFVPNREVKQMEAKVRARLDGIEYPYPLPRPDVCQQCSCPLQPGNTYSYTESISILPIYPKKTLYVIWSLNDKSNDESASEKKTEVCFIFMTRVTDAEGLAAFKRSQGGK